jgi:hypothetical protein
MRSESSQFSFDPITMLVALAEVGVDFVVVGGVAGGAHGSAYPTYDLDIAVAGNGRNLGRLADALGSLGSDVARIRTSRVFETSSGSLDVTVHPTRGREYARLARDAVTAPIEGHEVRFASIDHLIAMREMRRRPCDGLLSMELRVLADERRQS